MKLKRDKKEKKEKVKKIKVKKDRHSLMTLSVIDIAVYGFWVVAYAVCLIMRSRAFSTVQNSMALQGYTAAYTVEVSSPMFGVLSFLAKLLPVVIVLWTVLFIKKSKKSGPLFNKWIIIAVFAVNTLAVLLACVDIASLHMVLT